MWSSIIFLTLATLASSEDSDGQTARSQLARAMFERRSNHFDRALELLDQAEAKLTSPRLLAEVHRQRAMILADTDQSQRAVQSFIRAFTLEPSAPLRQQALSARAKDALLCARRLHDEDLDKRAWAPPPPGGWVCPTTSTARRAESGPTLTPKIDARARKASELIKTAAQKEPTSSWPPPTPTLVLGGVSLAGLGTGVAMGAMSAEQATDADASSDGKGLATAANVTFVVAAAAATAALLWWILDE